jgi:hypothetical protein
MASHATGKNTDLQVAAANHAADVQAKSAADALAFQKAQAETDWQNSQVTNRANYDQWAAAEGRKSGLGALIGLGPRDIPAYQPGIDPGFTTGATPSSTPTSPLTPQAGTPGASAGSSGDPVMDAAIANYKALGVSPTGQGSGPTDIAYFVNKIKQTGGLTPQNTAYWFGPQGRIAKELQGGVPAQTTPAAPMSFASSFLPPPTAPITPALTAPSPYSFAQMVR